MSETDTQTQEIQKAAAPQIGCRHLHRCQNCGTIWGHGNVLDRDISAHNCPKCAALEWRVYTGLQQAPAPQPKKGIDWFALAAIAAAVVLVYFVFRAARSQSA